MYETSYSYIDIYKTVNSYITIPTFHRSSFVIVLSAYGFHYWYVLLKRLLCWSDSN